ncbi:MAG: aminotransferase class I/II-fold pyridoxal phosphate-dependent enzyme, partial [Spirochaetaceae bacterium]|nr:aminotransferase class I/II-fold pyridoxal phosphate-dependent enzyme [Spirochaetaceae bacterium]
ESVSVRELLAMETGSEERLLSLKLGYTETRGAPELRANIAGLYEGLGAQSVFVYAGAEEAILNLCLATLSAGDHIVAAFPCYQSLAQIPRSLGCAVSPWSYRPSAGRWVLDLEELERLLRPATKMVVLNQPHNPTGALMRRDEFARVVELCRRSGALLLVDEVYRYLETDPARRLPAACDAYENGISLNVLSKSAGLAGLRIGWLATHRADILDAVAVVKDYNSICASGPSEVLAGIAVRNLSALVSRNRAIVESNLVLLRDFFARRSAFASWIEPEGGSIAFPRLTSRGADTPGGEDTPDARAIALRLLADTGVLLLPGELYGYDRAHFRIGFGRADMPAALAALDDWLDGSGRAR